MPIHLERNEHVTPGDETTLFDGINNEAVQARGMQPISTFGVLIKDHKQQLLGGAKAVVYYGCLYVDMLWVDAAIRRQGWGARLMQEAEKIGRECGCTFATVNTMDWEALPFYQKLGYEIEFIREGYVKAAKMFYLRKKM